MSKSTPSYSSDLFTPNNANASSTESAKLANGPQDDVLPRQNWYCLIHPSGEAASSGRYALCGLVSPMAYEKLLAGTVALYQSSYTGSTKRTPFPDRKTMRMSASGRSSSDIGINSLPLPGFPNTVVESRALDRSYLIVIPVVQHIAVNSLDNKITCYG